MTHDSGQAFGPPGTRDYREKEVTRMAKIHFATASYGRTEKEVPACGTRRRVTANYVLTEDPDKVDCTKCREHGNIYHGRVQAAYEADPKHLLVVRDLTALKVAATEAKDAVSAFEANIEAHTTVPVDAARGGHDAKFPYRYNAGLPLFDHEHHVRETSYDGTPRKAFRLVDLAFCGVCSGGHSYTEEDGLTAHNEDCALCAVESLFADLSGTPTEDDLPFPGDSEAVGNG